MVQNWKNLNCLWPLNKNAKNNGGDIIMTSGSVPIQDSLKTPVKVQKLVFSFENINLTFSEIFDLEWPWLSLKLIKIEVWHFLIFSPGFLTSKPSSLEMWFQGLQFLWRFDAILLRSSFLEDRNSSARIHMALKRHTAVYRLTFLTFFRDFWPLEYIFIKTYSKFILGDSGGPAVYYDKHKRAFDIVGVTIAGSETCSTSRATVKAGVYSNVLYYKDFINQATNNGCR